MVDPENCWKIEKRPALLRSSILQRKNEKKQVLFLVYHRVYFLYFHALSLPPPPLLLNLIIVEMLRLAKELIDCIIAIIIV